MHITDISITSIRRSMNGKRILGDVTFSIETQDSGTNRTLKVSCDTAYSNKIREDAVLLGDAIRQLRRLPETRSGEERISFAKGLRPLATSRRIMDSTVQAS